MSPYIAYVMLVRHEASGRRHRRAPPKPRRT
jgi:hypothetical protein